MKPFKYLIEPEEGQKFQILCRLHGEDWEHCDYAKDRDELKYLRSEYGMAYGGGFEFKTIRLN